MGATTSMALRPPDPVTRPNDDDDDDDEGGMKPGTRVARIDHRRRCRALSCKWRTPSSRGPRSIGAPRETRKERGLARAAAAAKGGKGRRVTTSAAHDERSSATKLHCVPVSSKSTTPREAQAPSARHLQSESRLGIPVCVEPQGVPGSLLCPLFV
jgi:hypothetical protein